MANVALNTDKDQYNKGETIIATFVVSGEDPGGEKTVVISGTVTIDGSPFTVEAAPVIVKWPPTDVRVVEVSAEGIDFAPTGDPLVWRGTAA